RWRGQRRLRIWNEAGRYLERRIFPQFLVIVEVFVSQRNCDDPLSEQGSLLVNSEDRVSRIWDDCIEGIKEPSLLGDLPEKERTGVGSETAPQKISDDRLAAEAGKPE